MVEQVRVRFAPSPTGFLHVGGARTALFSWLYAKHTGGTFVLRIEDTDIARSSDEAVTAIFESLRWLGLTWDEGPGAAEPHAPYFQTQRLPIYQAWVQRLLDAGRAFKCYMTPAELEAKRNEATAAGQIYRYDRQWALGLSADTVARYEAEGRPYVVRFRAPETGTIVVDDVVHGTVSFEASEIVDDYVLIKKDGVPTYNFACVVDDATMGITHVIRGDDHLSNTPKQIAVYDALGVPTPRFGHIPMILGPDKQKLSKRHGAVSVMQYAHDGYLPHALLNYLLRLGWAHGDQEIFGPEEMVAAFNLEGLNKTAAVFDVQKLDWLNAHYIKATPASELVEPMRPYWKAAGIETAGRDAAWLAGVIATLQERAKTLVQLAQGSKFYFDLPLELDEAAVAKVLTPEALEALHALGERLAEVTEWNEAGLEPAFKAFAEQRGLKLGAVIQPMRVAVTGRTASPGMYEVLALLGRDLTLSRVAAAATQNVAP